MRFQFTPEQETFRHEVRTFLAAHLPPGWESRFDAGGEGDSDAAWEFARGFTRRLAERKWLAMAWPKEYGGLAADHMTQLIYNEEMAYHRAPGGGGMGVAWVGPAVMLYGTDEQKGALPAPHHQRRGCVVHALLRAGRRLGPGRAADARRGRRR
jgi:alkylation response protein AidB-like acyl-CoA dehydrogenase